MKKRRSTNIKRKGLVQDTSKRMCTEPCKACGRLKKRELQMVHSRGAIGCTGLDHILLQEVDLFFASSRLTKDI